MDTPKAIHYTSGRTVENPVVVIEEDLNIERSGYVRAFWAESPDATIMSPVRGYCEARGSFRTIRACAADVRSLYPDAEIYRNGRKVK